MTLMVPNLGPGMGVVQKTVDPNYAAPGRYVGSDTVRPGFRPYQGHIGTVKWNPVASMVTTPTQPFTLSGAVAGPQIQSAGSFAPPRRWPGVGAKAPVQNIVKELRAATAGAVAAQVGTPGSFTSGAAGG